MLKFKYLCAACALCFAPLSHSDELSETGEMLDGIAAIVNEGVILKSKLRAQIANIIRQAQSQPEPIPLPPADVLREQVLERLVVNEVQLQRAERIGLQISDQMVNQAVANIGAGSTPPIAFEDMPAALAADGVNWAEFREQLREELTLEQLRRIDVAQRIPVSEREIRQCILDLETNVVANSAYNLSHIVVSISESASAAEIADVQQKMQDIYSQIQDGVDFRQLAIRYSEGQTALQGGSLGWMEGEQVPTLFTDVLAEMGNGDVSEPFRWSNSFHIVKVDDLRSAVERSQENQVLARHILVKPNEIIDDETAKQQLDDAMRRLDEGEDFGEIAKLMSDDPGSANEGGELGWAGPGTFVGEFEAQISQLDIGEMSEPFKSPFGWHVVEVMERRVYDNTEELKERNCGLAIRQSKLQEETQLWIRRLRDEAYVDTRS